MANNFSVSSADLARNLGNMSEIMAINNVSMEQQIGMLTGVTEITRNASSASRGLVMISSRLTQVLDNSSSTGKKLTKIYKDLGIELLNESGQLRSHYDILGDLAEKWDTLSENQQKYIALTSAGARQQQNFVALMANWNQVAKATTSAYESMGSAQKENEKVIDSISKKIEILRSEFQKFVIGDGGLQNVTKLVLDLGIALLKLANTPIGKITLEITLLTAGVFGLTTAIKSLTVAMSTNPLLLLITALSAIVVVAIEVANAEDKMTQAHRENIEAVKEAQEEYNSLVSEIKNLKKSLEEIENKKVNISNKEDLKELEKEEASLRRQVQLLEAKAELERKAAERTAKEELKSTHLFVGTDGEPQELSRIEAITAQKEMLEELSAEYDKLEEKEKQQTISLSKMSDAGSQAYKELEEEIRKTTEEKKSLGHQIEETESGFHDFLQETEELGEALTSADKETVKLKEDLFKGVAEGLKYFNEQSLSTIKEQLRQLSEGGNVDLTLRPRIDTEELKKAGYEAGEGVATVFTHTFTNKANNIAMNFTPIMVDPETGEYLGVMKKDEFEQYCEDVVNGVREDDLNLKIGVDFKKEEHEDFLELAEAEAEQIHELHEAEDELTDSIKVYNSEAEEETDVTEDVTAKIDELAKSLGLTAVELEKLNEQFDETQLLEYLTRLQDVKQTLSDTNSTIDNLQDALATASAALEEHNQKGYLTIDTFQSLIGISAQYLAALVNENGQLEVNQQTLSDLIDTLKIAKIEELAEAAAAEINALRNQEAEIASKNAETAVDAAGEAFRRAGDKAAKGAAGIEIFNAAMERAGIESTHGKQEKEIENRYKAIVEELSSWSVNVTKAGNASSSAGKKASSAAKDAKDATKELNKELEETKKKYDTVIKWISKQYDKEIDKIKKAKDEALKAEEAKIKAKEKEKDVALDAIEKEINVLEKEKKVLKEQKEVIDDKKQALKDEENAIVKSIETRIKTLEKERDALINPVEERIKVLEKERDTILDNTQTEIDALKELKEEREAYWDAQIDALKEANKELKDNLELQEKLDALEKAKNTKVKIYKEGQGFVYDVDQNAVEEAQKALDEYLSEKAYEDELARLENLKKAEITNYTDRLNELNKFKENTKKSYDEQIDALKTYKEETQTNYNEQIEALKEYKETVQEEFEAQIELLNQDIEVLEKHIDELDKHKEALEEHKDKVQEDYEAEIEALNAHKEAVQEQYEAEIEVWENYKTEFENMVNAYEEQQNKLLFEQLTGIKDESNNWMTRLDNLAEFVKKYNELQKQLDTDNTDVSNTANMSEGSTPISSSYSNGITTGTTRTVTNNNTSSARLGSNSQYTPSYSSNGSKYGSTPTFSSDALNAARNRAKKHASGISSISNDEIAIVGDSPNQELVIGSKMNGSLMSLDKGTGVVNADSSRTLAGILNQIGKYGASGFGSGNGTLNNNYNNDSLTINGVTIQGSNIKDPETFVNSLLNLKAEALQRAYSHK